MVVRHPSVVIITIRDSGRHFGCYGHKTLRTLAIDGVAQDGARTALAISISAVCSPARGSMLTGRYPQNNGLMGLAHESFYCRPNQDELHLAAILGQSGYESVLFGLQHETGHGLIRDPGFQAAYGWESLPEATGVAGEFVRWLKQRSTQGDVATAKSFYAQIGFWETHPPFDRDGTESDVELGVSVPPYIVDHDITDRVLRSSNRCDRGANVSTRRAVATV